MVFEIVYCAIIYNVKYLFTDGGCDNDSYRDGDYPPTPESAWMGDGIHDPGHIGGPYD